jgi:hypothetical protein
MAENNPLKSYFRKPGIWIKLPSQGKFYSERPAEFNDMGEIPVYPMTAKDELIMKNADALLNGSAINSLITSCVPSIKNVETMPNVDLDALLIAIRRCTYGEKIDISSTCDNCSATNENSIDLNHFISAINVIEDIDPIDVDDIKIYVKPINVKQLLDLNWVQYEQVRNIQLAEQNQVGEQEKVNILQESYRKLTEKNLEVISNCIDTVLLPDGTSVTDSGNIKEWAEQLSQPDFKKIELAIMSLSEKGVPKKFTNVCSACNTEYQAGLDLNPTTFFE